MSMAMSVEGAASMDQGDPSDVTNGRLSDPAASAQDRNFAVAMHLTPFAGLVFGPAVVLPVVLWLIRKDQSVFADDHGREVINFGLSFFLMHIILGITVIGILLYPVIWIVALVAMIRGASAAGSGEYFRYPMTMRFLS